MEKTTTEMIIPGGSPSTSENPPSTETGLKDSGQGQPLLDRSPYRGNTKITKLSTNKEDNTSDTNTNILGKKLDNNNNNKVKLQQTLPLEFFQGRARSNSTNSVLKISRSNVEREETKDSTWQEVTTKKGLETALNHPILKD